MKPSQSSFRPGASVGFRDEDRNAPTMTSDDRSAH